YCWTIATFSPEAPKYAIIWLLMVSYPELREWLNRYLAGEVSLTAFQEWFLPRAWTIEETGDGKLIQLVYDSQLALAEYTNGDWTEAELKELLALLARVDPAVPAPHSGS